MSSMTEPTAEQREIAQLYSEIFLSDHNDESVNIGKTRNQLLWYIATGNWITERQSEHANSGDLEKMLIMDGILEVVKC